MTTDLVPFGKHKGQPVTALAQDRDYCDWLLQQSWFVQRFPELHTIVVNNFGEPTETPEHNRLQLRFLEEDFRLRCMRLALEHYDPGFFEEKWSKPHRVQFEYELPTKYRQALNTGIPVFRRAYPYAAITTLHDPEFECHGIDVQWKFDQLSLAHHYTVEHHNTALFHERDQLLETLLGEPFAKSIRENFTATRHLGSLYEKVAWCLEYRYLVPSQTIHGVPCDLRDVLAHVAAEYAADEPFFVNTTTIHDYAWDNFSQGCISVECKPALGDDYPAVLRFMKSTQGQPPHERMDAERYLLVIDQFSARGGSLEQVKTLFRNSNFLLVTVSEIEATTPLEYYPHYKGLRPAHELVTLN